MRYSYIIAMLLLVTWSLSAQGATTNIGITVVDNNSPPPVGFLTTFTFQNDSGSTLPAGSPISFGQGFKYGDVTPGTYPIIRDASTHSELPSQWEEISRWRENGGNNSWRHAVWTVLLQSPLIDGAFYTVEFISVAGDYSQTSHQSLNALCNGPAAHDLKMHLTDMRNQDDSVRDSGDATFRVCDNINNTGRDAPRHLAAGNLYDGYVVTGLFTYTSGKKDPLLYVQCDIDIFTKQVDGSAGDVRWVCHDHNSWMNVGSGSAGNVGNVGPVGFVNDPQAISYKADILDGSTSVLNWSGLDATIASSSNPVTTTGCGFGIAYCMLVPSSTGPNSWYMGQAVRVTCPGGCIGGLRDGELTYVWPASTAGTHDITQSTLVAFQQTADGMEYGVPGYYKLTGAQGTGSTSFSARIQHYHWEAWDTLDTTGLVNWSPFGTASRVTRKVFPAFTRAEKTYWQQTGMFIPVDLDQPQSGSDSDYFPAILALGGSDKYEPMGRLDVIGGGGTGAASDIGVIGEWASHAFITGRQIDWDHARLISLNMPMHGQATLLDEATGRIPVLNNGPPTGPGGNGNGNSYPELGHPQPNLGWGPSPITGMLTPCGKPSAAPFEICGGTMGGGTGIDHMPAMTQTNYAIWGDRYLLDMVYWQANKDYLQAHIGPGDEQGSGFYRDNNARFVDGNVYHYYGLLTLTFQGRGSAWMMRDFATAAAFGGDNNVERGYLHDFLTETGNYWPMFENYRDGPGSIGYSGSIYPPNDPNTTTNDGSWANTFVVSYMYQMEYLLSAWLHEPLGNYWNMRNQQFIEGAVGSQMFGHPVSYYTVDYSAFYHVHDTRVKPSGINGIGEGPFLNGVDASDFASWFDPVTHFNVGPGGQVREQSGSGYIISPFDQIKMQTQWETNNDPPVDQLPGNRWFTIIAPIDNNVGTFFIRCEAADHIAFPTQCPVAGESFTGFTTNGVATDPNYTYDAPLYRFSFDPGANGGYLHGGYVPNMGVMINSLSILGFDVTHAKADFDFRTNVNNWYFESEPSFFWDRTVVVPGLPAIVTFSKEFPILACGTSPGTAITSLGMIQGNGAGASGWKITKSSDPSHYAVSGNNVITVGTVPCGASQMVEVQGTQSGGAAVKGQIHLHVNAGGSATIQALELSPRTFIATNGNKGTKIGNFAAQVSDGTFNAASGFALSNVGGCAGVSTNNNLFTTNGSELDIGTTDISGAGDKKICASAIDGSFSNSPQYKTFTITGILGPSLVVNGGSTVSVGQSVSITLSNGFGFNRDWIDIAPAGAGNDSSNWAYLNGSQGPPSSPVPLPATISLKANAPAGSYEVRYYENDTYTIGATTPLTVK